MAAHRFDASGQLEWSARYADPDGDALYARAVAIAPDGDVVVTGRRRASGEIDDVVTERFDGVSGSVRWVAEYDAPSGGDDEPVSVALASDGDVVVLAQSADDGGGAMLRFQLTAPVLGAAGTSARLSASIVAAGDFTVELDASDNAAVDSDAILGDAVFADGFE